MGDIESTMACLKEKDGHLQDGFRQFSLSKPREKLPKSIPIVTILILIGNPWQILYILPDILQVTLLNWL